MAEFDRDALTLRLRQRLLAAANPTGGWPYYEGNDSRVESTSWILMALADTSGDDPAARQAFAAPHLAFLAGRQRGDGLLAEHSDEPPNFTANGVAACAAARLLPDSKTALLTRLLDGLVAVRGVAIRTPILDTIAAVRRLVRGTRDAPKGQDNALQAWPWIPDTFSWAEPTAWCLLALKQGRRFERPGADLRIAEAERLLVDRMCTGGGWNYGNRAAFAQDLRPYVPTTAVALMALQDRPDDPAVRRSLTYLDRAKLSEPSAIGLGLSAICLHLYGRPTGDLDERLAADMARAERFGNLQALAIALYGLGAAGQHGGALRVP